MSQFGAVCVKKLFNQQLFHVYIKTEHADKREQLQELPLFFLRLLEGQICEVAGTDKQGTNAYGVIKAAKHLGFSAKGVKGNKESFFSEFPLPCIAVECPSKNGVSSTFMNRIMKTINKSNLSGKYIR